jgi:hypothetical protein
MMTSVTSQEPGTVQVGRVSRAASSTSMAAICFLDRRVGG